MPQNSEKIINERMDKVAALYLKGMPQVSIADQVGVSAAQVTRDLQKLNKQWIARSQESIDKIKAEQLAKLDYWEGELSTIYEKSKEEIQIQVQEQEFTATGKKGKQKAQVKRIPGRADEKIIDRILKILEMRCKILGIDSNVTVNLNQININPKEWVK